MSHDMTAAAWEVSLPSTAKLVLLSLADRAGVTGTCFPSLRDTMARTGLAETTVRRDLSRLEAAGYLRREFRTNRSTVYRLLLIDAPPVDTSIDAALKLVPTSGVATQKQARALFARVNALEKAIGA